jgi:hypothetical protein
MSSASISEGRQEQQISELVGCVGRVRYGKVRIFYTVEDLGQRCTNKEKQGPNTVVILKITMRSAAFLQTSSNYYGFWNSSTPPKLRR